MASTTKTLTLISLAITLLLNSQIASSFNFDQAIIDDEQEDEVYVLDSPTTDFRSRSGFLVSVIKKGAQCNKGSKNICNGVSANKGSGLLYCCKTHCRNVLRDRNNCGGCGNKCSFGELCCGGTCTNVAYNDDHCGKCSKQCPSGVKCVYGTCGYA